MEITYQTKKLRKVCESIKESDKTFGSEMTFKIHMRLDQIRAAETIEELIQNHIGRCHPLENNRKGQYAMDLVHPFRLVFEKHGTDIQIAHIIQIVDYH